MSCRGIAAPQRQGLHSACGYGDCGCFGNAAATATAANNGSSSQSSSNSSSSSSNSNGALLPAEGLRHYYGCFCTVCAVIVIAGAATSATAAPADAATSGSSSDSSSSGNSNSAQLAAEGLRHHSGKNSRSGCGCTQDSLTFQTWSGISVRERSENNLCSSNVVTKCSSEQQLSVGQDIAKVDSHACH